MNQELQRAMEKNDSIVFKRLKFVYKIMKAICAQPNNKNRQAHVYILEVLDAIGDWSGNYNTELADLLEDEIFPLICVIISSFNRDEFNSFQLCICKYLLKKWDETSNFAVLDLLADMYGFITRIAPSSVVEEYVEVFSQEKMPIHVHLVILPAILRNLTEGVSYKLNGHINGIPVPMMCLSHVSKDDMTDHQRQLIKEFWTSFADSTKYLTSFKKSALILNQCIITSSYFDLFTSTDLIIIMQDLMDWGSVVKGFHLDLFLIISTIFLSSSWAAIDDNSIPTFHMAMKNLMLLVCKNANASTNKDVSIFAVRIVQRILEHSEKELKEVLGEIYLQFDLNETLRNSPPANPNPEEEEMLRSLEKCIKRISTEPALQDSELCRKRLKLLISDLEGHCYEN